MVITLIALVVLHSKRVTILDTHVLTVTSHSFIVRVTGTSGIKCLECLFKC